MRASDKPFDPHGDHKPDIERCLRRLIGLEMLQARANAGVQEFRFGRHATRFIERETPADFVLQISCPWRLTMNYGIGLGGGGRLDCQSEIDDTNASYSNLLAVAKLRVTGLAVDRVGGFRLMILRSSVLEILPIAPSRVGGSVEFWRLFQPGVDTRCLVVTSGAVEFDVCDFVG